MVWTREELTALGRICTENDVIVVSDEIHADLIYSGTEHTPFASISEEFAMNSIVTMSASKTFNIAGLSSAYLVIANEKFSQAYKRFMQATHISSGNFFGLVATESAYTYGDEWLSQLLAYLEENRNLISSFMAKHLPKVKVMVPEGTYLVWIDFSDLSISTKDVYDKLVMAGIGLSTGSMFGNGGENFLRLNMGCPRSILQEALNRMKQTLEKY